MGEDWKKWRMEDSEMEVWRMRDSSWEDEKKVVDN